MKIVKTTVKQLIAAHNALEDIRHKRGYAMQSIEMRDNTQLAKAQKVIQKHIDAAMHNRVYRDNINWEA